MSSVNIIAVVGSSRKESINLKLFNAIKKLAPAEADINLVEISQLPLFNQDDEANPPDVVKQFKAKIEAADGVLFITPEHNRSFTASIKNAMDWGSRPYGSNSWDKKPSAVTGATGGMVGTFGAQNHLRQVAVGINTYMMANPQVYFTGAYEKFNDQGELIDDDSAEVIKNFAASFVDWVKTFKN